MKSSLAGFVIALVVTASLIPMVRRLAYRVGAVDEPGTRRVNQHRVARLGGVAVVVGFFAPLAILFFTESSVARMFFDEPKRIVGLATGASLIVALGVVDDIRGLGARSKFPVQILAAVAAYAGGYHIDAFTLPGVGVIALGWLALPATVLWFVAIINALNLIDGLDGLAAGIAFFACVSNFIVGYVNEAHLVWLLSASLGGAILGFLFYNFNPASIFMGDSGSMFLGYTLAATALLGATIKSSTTVAILVPILALGIPIMDTVWALLRRLLKNQPMFLADREHLHHRLIDGGHTHRRAVLVLYALSIVLTCAAIALALGRSWEAGGALVIVAIVLFGLVRTAARLNKPTAPSEKL